MSACLFVNSGVKWLNMGQSEQETSGKESGNLHFSEIKISQQH